MRNMLAGGALAIVLIAALFAAATYGRRPAEIAAPQGPLADDFIGEQKFGAWKLVCNEAKDLPRRPSDGRTGNSEGTAPREAPPPPGWKLPRCLVGLVLHNPRKPEDEIRVTFRTIGFKRVLALFLRLAHDEVGAGDEATARFDQRAWPMPVRCNPQFCLAIQSIKFADVPAVIKAKSMSIAFHPAGSENAVLIPVPAEGLGDAIETMRRLNH
jgi:invasion protein IalB